VAEQCKRRTILTSRCWVRPSVHMPIGHPCCSRLYH
jgi:hypothetical protein